MAFQVDPVRSANARHPVGVASLTSISANDVKWLLARGTFGAPFKPAQYQPFPNWVQSAMLLQALNKAEFVSK